MKNPLHGFKQTMNDHASAFSEEDRIADIRVKGKAWAEDVSAANAWHRLVLTLDGGGIRGYSELLILQDLMTRIVAWELKLNKRVIDIKDILPCHYFDYIWGTSTGGLVALMLGRLRMSVLQALEVYRGVGDTIFGETRKLNARGVNILATKYKHRNVRAAVTQITKNHCKLHQSSCTGDDELLWPDQSDLGVNNTWNICQAVCVTARTTGGKSSQAQPLRSYEYIHHQSLYSHDPNAGIQDLDLKIWEAGRATSAAPQYFKMFEKRDERGNLRRYKDGGTLLNNPAEKALNEVKDRYGLVGKGRKQDRVNPALLLSIGTGIRANTPFAELNDYPQSKRENKSLWSAITNRVKERVALARHVVIRYTEGELIHWTIRETVGNEHTWYRRLNVDVGLGKMSLGDWRRGIWHNPATNQDEMHPGGATLTDMEKATTDYLTRKELHTDNNIEWYLLPSEHLEHIAERLVRHRTKRRENIKTEADRLRWHTFQGRYAYGDTKERWTDDSCDKPYTSVVAAPVQPQSDKASAAGESKSTEASK